MEDGTIDTRTEMYGWLIGRGSKVCRSCRVDSARPSRSSLRSLLTATDKAFIQLVLRS